MKKQVYQGLTALLVMATTMTYGQSYDNNNNRQYDNRNYDSRSSRSEDERNYQNNDSRNNDNRNNDRSDRDYQNNDSRNNDSRYNDRRNDNRDRNQDSYRSDNRNDRQYEDRDLREAYDKGYDDGLNDGQRNMNNNQQSKRKESRGKYQSFAFGLYGGLNSTFLSGESVNGNNPQGRLGYQLGGYVRGGGRLFGQIGVEYLTSSTNIITKGDGTVKNLNDVINGVDQKYIHIPAYIGVKLAQSPRGMSAIRLQVGAELATVTSNQTEQTLNNSSVNGLANLGFDAGPLTIDFVYHYGFNNTIQNQAVTYKPRILGVNVGIKF